MKKYIALLLFFGSFGVVLANHLGPWKTHPDSECPNGSNLCPLSYAGMSLVSCSVVSIPGVMAQCTYDGRSAAGRSAAAVSAGSSAGDSRVVINIPISTAASPAVGSDVSVGARAVLRPTAPLSPRAAALWDAVASRSASRPAPSRAVAPSAPRAAFSAASAPVARPSNAPSAMPSSFSAPSAFSAMAPVAGNAPAIPNYMQAGRGVSGPRVQVLLVGVPQCVPDGIVSQVRVVVNDARGYINATYENYPRITNIIGGSQTSIPFKFDGTGGVKSYFPTKPSDQYNNIVGRPNDNPRSLRINVTKNNISIGRHVLTIDSNMCPTPCDRLYTDRDCNTAGFDSNDQQRCVWNPSVGPGGVGGIGELCERNPAYRP